MAKRSSPPGNKYVELIGQLKSFVNFPFDVKAVLKGKATLKARDKAFISNRHKEVFGFYGKDGRWHGGLNDDGLQFYPVKSEKRRLVLQRAVHQRYVSKSYKGAFILTAGQPAKVTWKGDKPTIRAGAIAYQYADFNKRALVKNPKKEVQRAVKECPDAKTFKIQCGPHVSSQAWGKGAQLEGKVIEWMNTYGVGGDKFKGHNHFSKWMGGLVGFIFGKQTSYKKFVNLKKKYSEAKKVKNRQARRTRKGK